MEHLATLNSGNEEVAFSKTGVEPGECYYYGGGGIGGGRSGNVKCYQKIESASRPWRKVK